MRMHLGPIKQHVEAIERWGEDAFAYPTDPHNPWMTAACRECGARCSRIGMRCLDCMNAAKRAAPCLRGHDMTNAQNVHITSKGQRRCRACERERGRRRRAAAKETT